MSATANPISSGVSGRRDRPGHADLWRRAFTITACTCWYLSFACLLAPLIGVVRGRIAGRRFLMQRLLALLQRLGPTFIKGAQILGTRRDILPATLSNELSSLQDSVAPMSAVERQIALKQIYGEALNGIFEEVEAQPVAAGSVACVYRARLRNGREVAIKLQRPGLRATMTADLALLRAFGRGLARFPLFRGVPVVEVLAYLSRAVYDQLDFGREAANLKRLRDNLSTVARVWVPRLEAEYSRDQAVVMEFIPELNRQVPEHWSEAARQSFAAATLTAVYHMLFIDGFVHCDLHPGNLYFTRGQVVILDAGFSVQLSDRMRRLFAEFFLEMSLGRGRRCAEIVVESSTGISPTTDLESFMEAMQRLVERNAGLPAKDFSLIGFATGMFDLQRRFGLAAATELLFPLLSLLVIEGTVRELDPEVDFQDLAKAVLMRGIFSAPAQRW